MTQVSFTCRVVKLSTDCLAMPVSSMKTASPSEPERSFKPTGSKRVLMALAYYEHRMHVGVARYASEANWILDTRMAHYGSPPEDWQGDGILALTLPDRPDLSDFLRMARVPIVGLTNDVAGVATARVVLDNFSIGRKRLASSKDVLSVFVFRRGKP